MVIIGCFEVMIFLHNKFMLNVKIIQTNKSAFMTNIKIVGPKGTDLPLLWGFVRDAGDFSGGFFRSGDATAAKLSCQLSVHLASSVPLVVHEPVIRTVIAHTFNDEDTHNKHVQYCR